MLKLGGGFIYARPHVISNVQFSLFLLILQQLQVLANQINRHFLKRPLLDTKDFLGLAGVRQDHGIGD